jgi:hypothetical protein
MTVRLVRNNITPSLRRNQRRMEALPREAYEFWVSITPVRSGRARRSTRLSGDTIQAAYPYAQPLDSGSSSQAPDGMSGPTGNFIRRWFQRNIRK